MNSKDNFNLAPNCYLVLQSRSGHHPSYAATLVRLTGYQILFVNKFFSKLHTILFSRSIFFVTIDVSLFYFFSIAALRAIIGKPTSGILINPLSCFYGALALKRFLKRSALYFLKRLHSVNVISVLPFYVDPKIVSVCDDWVHDLQLWDLLIDERNIRFDLNLKSEVWLFKGNRSLTIFIGSITLIKGFYEFLDYVESSDDRECFVVAGLLDKRFPIIERSLNALISNPKYSGRLLIIDRFISDEEINSLYCLADRSWCYYNASYNQSSGVYGRSIQFSVKPIVRPGSILNQLNDSLPTNTGEGIDLRVFDERLNIFFRRFKVFSRKFR